MLHEKQGYQGIINTRDYLNCKWAKAKQTRPKDLKS